MEWYYVQGGDRKGPVAEEEFQRLTQQGVITSGTLVWREGMPNWEPYAGAVSSPALAAATTDSVTCAGCGKSFARADVIPLGTGVYCATCKPAALQRLREGVVATSGAEEMRKQYLKHEASVKSIGILYYFGGAALFVMGTVLMFSAAAVSGIVGAIPGLFFLGLGGVQLWAGYGLRRLKPWARVPTGILSGIGLIGFPLGTIINGYILYLVFSQKGKTVFSDEYRAVIEQTPHIKYRTSLLVWILLILIIGLIAIGLLALILNQR